MDRDQFDVIRLSLPAVTQSFYDEFTRDGNVSYRELVNAFTKRDDSPRASDDNSVLLASLTIGNYKNDYVEDHATLNTLEGKIEAINPLSAARGRGSEEKSQIFLQAVPAEPWYLHAERKCTYPYDFTSVVDSLQSSTRALKWQVSSAPSRSTGMHPTRHSVQSPKKTKADNKEPFIVDIQDSWHPLPAHRPEPQRGMPSSEEDAPLGGTDTWKSCASNACSWPTVWPPAPLDRKRTF